MYVSSPLDRWSPSLVVDITSKPALDPKSAYSRSNKSESSAFGVKDEAIKADTAPDVGWVVRAKTASTVLTNSKSEGLRLVPREESYYVSTTKFNIYHILDLPLSQSFFPFPFDPFSRPFPRTIIGSKIGFGPRRPAAMIVLTLDRSYHQNICISSSKICSPA